MTPRQRKTREEYLDFVRGIFRRAEEKGRGDPHLRQSLRVHIGISLEKMGRWSAAMREYRAALLESKREAKRRKDPRGAEMVAEMRGRLSRLAAQRGHLESSVALLRANRRGLKSALRRWPDEESLVGRLGDTGRRLAGLVRRRRGDEAARRTLVSAVRDLDALAARNPASLVLQREIADSCVALADLFWARWQSRPRAETHFRRAEAIYRTLFSLVPADWTRMALASVVQQLGCHALQTGRPGRARSLFEESLALILGAEDLALQLDVEPLRIAECCDWAARAHEIGGDHDPHACLRALAAYEAAARRGIKGRKWRAFGLDVAGYGVDLCLRLMRLARDAGRPWEVAGFLRRGHDLLHALGWRLPPADREYHERVLAEEAQDE